MYGGEVVSNNFFQETIVQPLMLLIVPASFWERRPNKVKLSIQLNLSITRPISFDHVFLFPVLNYGQKFRLSNDLSDFISIFFPLRDVSLRFFNRKLTK